MAVDIIHIIVVNNAPIVVSLLLTFLLGAIVYINLMLKYIMNNVNGHLNTLNTIVISST